VIYSEAIPHSLGLRCEKPECSWNLPLGPKAYLYIVGFEHGGQYKNEFESLILGKLIFECPTCFEKFWIHAGWEWLDHDSLILFCPNWPK
jgi:hypothetical protein